MMAENVGLNIFVLASLLALTLTLVHSTDLQSELEVDSLKKDRTIDSLTCIARRFCTAEAAIEALISERSLSYAQAEEVTNYTHGTSGIKWNSCSCSITCGLSGDCCADAQPLQKFPKSILAITKCDFYDSKFVAVIDSCPADTDDTLAESLHELCQNGTGLVKMTNPNSYVTYSNIYCAMCHGEVITELRPWNLQLICTEESNNFGDTGNKTEPGLASERCIIDDNAPQTPPKDLDEKISIVRYGAVLQSRFTARQACNAIDGVMDTCPQGTPSAKADECSNGVASYVATPTSPLVLYRNPACAQCNNIQRGNLQCQICGSSGVCQRGDEIINNGFLPRFSILVQPYAPQTERACRVEKGGAECTGKQASFSSCNTGEYLDSRTVMCMPICPPGTILFKGTCIIRNRMTTAICDSAVSYESYLEIGRKNNITQSKFNHNAFYMDLNNGTVICHSCIVNVKTEHDEGLTRFTNGSVKMKTSVVDHLLTFEEDNSTFLCLPTTVVRQDDNTAYLREILDYTDWLTLILCIISILFLILFFVAFCLVKRMRNIPGSTIAGNMLMFLLAYIFFLARGFNDLYPNAVMCKIISVLINYFFVAAFVFMIIYAVLIIRSLEFVDLDSRYTPTTVTKIWFGGLLLPFIVIIPALLLDEFIPNSVWSPGYGGKECFMSHREGNVIFFTVPIALCLVISVVIYIVVVQRLRQIAAATSRVRASHREKVYLCFKLIVVLGFNWISAVLAAAVDRTTYPVANEILTAIFIVVCCLHGFFGFIVFVASGSNIQQMKAKYQKLTSTDQNSSSGGPGGRAVRTYSGPTSTAASELSTMIRKTTTELEPKSSPVLTPKLADPEAINHKDYSSIDSRLSPNTDSGLGDDKKYNESPISNRSTTSKNKCDFF